MLAHFADGNGGFFDTADDETDPRLARRRPGPDRRRHTLRLVSGRGCAAHLCRLHRVDRRTATPRSAALGVYAPLAGAHARFAGWGLAVAEALLDGPREVAVVGEAGDPATARLHSVALARDRSGSSGRVGQPGGHSLSAGGHVVPLLEHRPLVGGKPAAYVCHHFTCDAPVTDPAALAAALGSRA